MEINRANNERFSISTGPKVVAPVLPAMPIHILYLAMERDYSLQWQGGAAQFQMRIPEHSTPEWGFQYWDANNLRDSFEALKTPQEAFQFLNVTGPFRNRRDEFASSADVLSWNEIAGWQRLMRRIRLLDPSQWFPLLPVRTDDTEDRFAGWEFWSDESDVFLEQLWLVADETYCWLQGIPEGLAIRRDMYLSMEETKAIFSAPGATVAGSREWESAQRNLARERAKRARGNVEGKQNLVAEILPTCTLNAILATIYVEKLRGIEIQVCALKECNETFPVESSHGKAYCSNYHAHLASVRRKRAEAKMQKDKRIRRKGSSK